MNHDDIVDTLNDLIEVCKDGEYGFQTSAEYAKSEPLKRLLTKRGQECKSAAAELQALVQHYGGKPDNSGSVAGAMHRGWVATRAALSTYNDLAVLEECERGEDRAVAAYRKALKDNALPSDVQALVERQSRGAKENHDMVREMRDSLKAQQNKAA